MVVVFTSCEAWKCRVSGGACATPHSLLPLAHTAPTLTTHDNARTQQPRRDIHTKLCLYALRPLVIPLPASSKAAREQRQTAEYRAGSQSHVVYASRITILGLVPAVNWLTFDDELLLYFHLC